MNKLKVGAMVWIPCEVKPGPFSNERVVLVESERGPWIGFVDVSFLQNDIETGKTFIRARVVSVEANVFQATLPGHSVTASRVIQEQRDKVSLAPLPA